MRSPTRSDVKWLVNQVAALAGELSQLEVEASRLAERCAIVEKERQACVRTLSIITGPSALTAVLPTVRVHRFAAVRVNAAGEIEAEFSVLVRAG